MGVLPPALFFLLQQWIDRHAGKKCLRLRLTWRSLPSGPIETELFAEGPPDEVRAALTQFEKDHAIESGSFAPPISAPGNDRGRELQAEAAALMTKARAAHAEGNEVESETFARSALGVARAAVDRLEDTVFEDKAHKDLDGFGRWTREHFPDGCRLNWDGSKYLQACPVALAHVRAGWSLGGSALKACSLCGEDLMDCPHSLHRRYETPGGPSSLGLCRVCGQADCVDHSPDERYEVYPIAIVTDLNVEEISLVSRPKNRAARIMLQTVDMADVLAVADDDFAPGDLVRCDRCIYDCSGFRELRGDL
jgi:hypothetical protein